MFGLHEVLVKKRALEDAQESGTVTEKASGVPTEWYFMVLDSIFLSIYVLEAVLKLIALGLEYFYDPWNNLGGWVRLR